MTIQFLLLIDSIATTAATSTTTAVAAVWISRRVFCLTKHTIDAMHFKSMLLCLSFAVMQTEIRNSIEKKHTQNSYQKN